VAALFLAFVHDLDVAGACVVLVARVFLAGDGGVSPLVGLQGEKPSPVSHGSGIALAAVGTLSFGAVLGPEMPLIALGSIVGLVVAVFVPPR
jgi:chloride channel protein, CIC family